jgi:hypothetical protein
MFGAFMFPNNRAPTHKPNCTFNADANTGHGFAILLASVGTLRPYGLRRRLTLALGLILKCHEQTERVTREQNLQD